MKSSMRLSIMSLVMFAGLLGSSAVWALNVGDTVTQVQVRDANNNPAPIPDLGKKVFTIFYTDPDVKDANEPFRELLKAQNLDESIYRGMGIANLKDTWKPNFIIRKVIRDKIAKFKALILTDTDHTLKNQWKLGDCDQKDMLIIIGKDRKVYYINKNPLTPAEMKEKLQLVKDLMKK